MKQHISVENFIPDEALLESYKEETFHYIDKVMEHFLLIYMVLVLFLLFFRKNLYKFIGFCLVQELF